MKTTEKLTIYPVSKTKVGSRVYFWVNLETEKETRHCCYTRYNGMWCYEDGDKEPEMSDMLKSEFHGAFGNERIQRCYKTGKPVDLAIDSFYRN